MSEAKWYRKNPEGKTLHALGLSGWYGAKATERLGPKRDRDWCGFADLLMVHPAHGWLAVQATTAAHIQTRIKKITDTKSLRPAVIATLSQGRIEVWGWRHQAEGGIDIARRFEIVRDIHGALTPLEMEEYRRSRNGGAR